MVKKLFKHEYIAYMRSLLLVHLILLGMAALTRFIFVFESDSTVFDIISVSSVVVFVIACVVSMVPSFINVITRFYKNLFTNEGYLSFTLPVTSDQHLLVKAISAVSILAANFVIILVAFIISTVGEFTVELFKAIGWLTDKVVGYVGWQFWLFVLELIVIFIVLLFVELLMFYSCITIGQLSNKNRVALSIGVYFGYYFASQILSTIFITVIQVISNEVWFSKWLESIGLFIFEHPYLSGHLFFLGILVISAIMGTIYYFISRIIMKKKLNLE